jgi:hypothetical protein
MLTFVLFFLGLGICVTLNWFFYVQTVKDIKAVFGVDPQEPGLGGSNDLANGVEADATKEETSDDSNDVVLGWTQAVLNQKSDSKDDSESFLQVNAYGSLASSDSYTRRDLNGRAIGGSASGSGSGAAKKRWHMAGSQVLRDNIEEKHFLREKWDSLLLDAKFDKLTRDEQWEREVAPKLREAEANFQKVRAAAKEKGELDEEKEAEMKQEAVDKIMKELNGQFRIPDFMLATFAPHELQKRDSQILLRAFMDAEVQHLMNTGSKFASKSPFSQDELTNRVVTSTQAMADLKKTIKEIARRSLKTENLLADQSVESEKRSVSSPYLSLLQTIEVDPRGGEAWFEEHGKVRGNYKTEDQYNKRLPQKDENLLLERGNLRNELRNLTLLDTYLASLKQWQVEEARSWEASYARRFVADNHAGVISWVAGKFMDKFIPIAKVALIAML